MLIQGWERSMDKTTPDRSGANTNVEASRTSTMQVDEPEAAADVPTPGPVDAALRGAATVPVQSRGAAGSPLAFGMHLRATGKTAQIHESERQDRRGPARTVLGAPPNYHEDLLKNRGHGRNAHLQVAAPLN